jgi:hypothetical protein
VPTARPKHYSTTPFLRTDIITRRSDTVSSDGSLLVIIIAYYMRIVVNAMTNGPDPSGRTLVSPILIGKFFSEYFISTFKSAEFLLVFDRFLVPRSLFASADRKVFLQGFVPPINQ